MKKNDEAAQLQPDELGELKKIALEYVKRQETIDNEIETLKDDKKSLREEYEKRIDMKTLASVIRILKIEAGVKNKSTFDALMEVLKDPAQ